jgi:hypothetical protein
VSNDIVADVSQLPLGMVLKKEEERKKGNTH